MDILNKDAVQQALTNVLQQKGQLSKLPFLLAQVAHETGGFKSHVSSVNNYSGIKFSAKSKIQGEYDSGIKSPEGNNYSGFDSINDWANRYYAIINKGAMPLNATTIEDFANRLKKNGYFTDTIANYTKGLQSWAKSLKMTLPQKAIATGTLLLIGIVIFLIYKMNNQNG